MYEITRCAFTTRRIDRKEYTAVAVVGGGATYADVFTHEADARNWATDVLVAYFDHTYSEAADTVAAAVTEPAEGWVPPVNKVLADRH